MNHGSAKQGALTADAASHAVREELRRIVTSTAFEDSERLVGFLTFVVEDTLAGRGDALKESTIGVEVFRRAPGYDPKVDPIVRVQARRLRTKLEAWYQTGGQTSALRIGLPKGGYTPEFGPPPAPEATTLPTAPPPRKSSIKIVLAAVAAILILGVGAAFFVTSRPKPSPPGSRLFTAYRGYQTSPAFSPDGLALAFSIKPLRARHKKVRRRKTGVSILPPTFSL